jgi:hypothetical protein
MATPQLGAQTVAWGTSGSQNPLVFTSDGNVDGDTTNTTHTLTWELGWFSDGYVVTDANWDTWAENWHRASSLVPEPDPEDPNIPPATINYPYHRYFADTGDWAVTVNTYDPSAYGEPATGKKAYIFVHNGMDKIGSPQGEVLLYTENLTFPAVPSPYVGGAFDIADNPDDPIDNNFTVIWGRVDRNMKADGGVLQGSNSVDMVISNPVPDSSNPVSGYGTFEAQSATWVPEPASALLVFLGGAVAVLRRRREA